MTSLADLRLPRVSPRALAAGLGAAAALAGLALANNAQARAAERSHPPLGRMLDVQGARVHVLDRGQGAPVVLLHGNGSMVEDFVSSGLVDRLARRNRVLVFDRPGYGHSSRPRDRVWTPEAQADLVAESLVRLGATGGATVVGHSWGCLVAVALAARHPTLVRGLVLEAGYFHPSLRLDAAMMGAPAVPVVGDLLRHTVSPLLARLIWPLLMRHIFGPAPVPLKFDGFPREMALRPSQIRAGASESGQMVGAARRLEPLYGDLGCPVAIIAGTGDRMVSHKAQSVRLQDEIPGSSLHLIPGVGHMAHQTAMPEVAEVIEAMAGRASEARAAA